MGEPAIGHDHASESSYRGSLYSIRLAEKRQGRRARMHLRVVHPISTPQLVRDPLIYHATPLRSAARATRVLISAVALHGAALIAFLILNRFIGKPPETGPSTAVMVEIKDVPIDTPPPVIEEEPEDGPIVDDFEPSKEIEPPPSEVPPPPAAPVSDAPPELTPEEPPLPRRIVGLSFESTVEGGSGPSFATGTSRMGRTERQAVAPADAQRRSRPSTPTGSSQREQRAAAHIPTQGGKLIKPRRTTPRKPAFPATLRAQGIEGEVVVRVKIAASGRVTDVTVLQSSGHAAFDDVARKTALSETFEPATRDNKPIPFTLSYTYRFRIED